MDRQLKEKIATLSPEQRALLLRQLQRKKAQAPPPLTPLPRPAAHLPLSFAQRRLWFLDQFIGQTAAYNMRLAFSLKGPLHVTALQKSLQTLVDRHEVLRLIYEVVDGEPTLHPHPHPLLSLETMTWQADKAALDSHIAQVVNHPFDLSRDLPIRAHLIQLTPQEHILLLIFHHIACDGWSFDVALRELSTLYQAEANGRSPDLPPLPIQYADYAHWQATSMTTSLNDQLAYWRQQLAEAPTLLHLPTDRPRPAVRTHDGAAHTFQLDPTLSQKIRHLAQVNHLTPFILLLTAFQILLHRLSGQDDIIIGAPIAGRNQPQVEPLIGLFLNTLVLRTPLSDDPTATAALTRTKQIVLDAFSNQDVPVEKLVDDLQLTRDLSHTPLFQVLFNYLNTPQTHLELPGLHIEELELPQVTAKLDLNLTMSDHPQGMQATLTYSTDLFQAETIARLADRYQTLLADLVAHPHKRLSQLAWMSASETAAVSQVWHHTDKPYGHLTCLHRRFEQQAARTPDAPAVHFDFQSYTYRTLNERANQLAHYLQHHGVQPEVRVGLFMERSLDTLVALLAVLKAGGAYVPIDPIYPPERIRFMLADVQVALVITQAALTAHLPPTFDQPLFCIDTDWPQVDAYSRENLAVTPASNNLKYLLFTSGSTGRPKAVAVEHRNYLNYFAGVCQQMGVIGPQTYAMVTTFATDLGSTMWWCALCFGGDVHIISYERATDPDAFAAYCRRYPMDVLKLVPSHYEALMAIPDPGQIIPRKLLIITGEATYWQTVRQVRQYNPALIIQDHYGVTETTCATAVYAAPFTSLPDSAAAIPKGTPLPNCSIHLLDDQMHPVPIGITGELYIGGEGVTRGYANRPCLTAERFLPDPDSIIPGARRYRTGDLALYQSDHTLKLLGRSDFQVKIRGYRIETGEIESLLTAYPTVQDAIVVAATDEAGDARLVAYWVPQTAAAPPTINDLRRHLRTHLPDYMVPAAFVILPDGIPLNPNGKVDRFALPEPDVTITLGDDFVAPRTALEETIATAWCQVLNLEKIGIDDNFFDSGGDSFKAIRVVRQLGPDVSVVTLFKHPTIRQLAQALASDDDQEEGLLLRLTPPRPPQQIDVTIVCVPYGGGSAVIYQPIAQSLPPNYALYALEMPGHDFSRREDPKRPLTATAAAAAQEILTRLPGPIALYGHCVGSAWAVEITRQLEAAGREVVGVFLGATFPRPRPQNRLLAWWSRLSPSERWISNRLLYEEMREVGGFSEVIDPAEQAFVIETMRYDAKQAEDYFTQIDALPDEALNRAPIHCIIGGEDPMTEFHQERIAEWRQYSPQVDAVVLPQVGHYFIKHQAAELGQILTRRIEQWQQTAKTAVVTPTPPPTAAAHRPNINTFLLVALGQLVSMIGTSLTGFAVGIWALQRTGRVLDFTIIGVFILLPAVLVSPFAGVVADRYDRRQVMIASDIFAALGTLLLAAFLWTEQLQVWHIYVSVALGSIATAFQRPAYMAAIAQLVPKQQLGRANGVAEIANTVGEVVSPFLGGVLLVSIGLRGVILIDFATFLFAIAILWRVRFPNTLFRKLEETFIQQVLGGWRYIIRRPSLVAMITFFALYNLIAADFAVLVPPMILAFDSEVGLGTALSMLSVGILVGALLMIITGGTPRRSQGMLLFAGLSGVGIIFVALQPQLSVTVMGMLLYGCCISLIDAHWLAIIQVKIPFKLQGRVIATSRMFVSLMTPIGYIIAGLLADRWVNQRLLPTSFWADNIAPLIGTGPGRGMAFLLIMTGVILVVWSGLGYLYAPLRCIESRLEDAIPEGIILSDLDALQAAMDEKLE